MELVLTDVRACGRNKGGHSGPPQIEACRPVGLQLLAPALEGAGACIYLMPDSAEMWARPASARPLYLGPELYRVPYGGARYGTGPVAWHKVHALHRTQIQILSSRPVEMDASVWPYSNVPHGAPSELRLNKSTEARALVLGTRYGEGIYDVRVSVRYVWDGHEFNEQERPLEGPPRVTRYTVDPVGVGQSSEVRYALNLTWEIRGWGLLGRAPWQPREVSP